MINTICLSTLFSIHLVLGIKWLRNRLPHRGKIVIDVKGKS
jgi:hypothetical protein